MTQVSTQHVVNYLEQSDWEVKNQDENTVKAIESNGNIGVSVDLYDFHEYNIVNNAQLDYPTYQLNTVEEYEWIEQNVEEEIVVDCFDINGVLGRFTEMNGNEHPDDLIRTLIRENDNDVFVTFSYPFILSFDESFEIFESIYNEFSETMTDWKDFRESN